MTRFAVLVLCPGASYSDLLMESRKHDVTVLEMIPFSAAAIDYDRYFESEQPHPILFVLGRDRSALVERSADLTQALRDCCGNS